MGKKGRCAECNEEMEDKDAFRHEGKEYCPECTIEHMKDKHANAFRRPLL